jgi:hypothetical protein
LQIFVLLTLSLQGDEGIKKIKELEECLEDDKKFMEILQILEDKAIWLSVTTRDLYYWINVLDKVDILMKNSVEELNKLNEGKERVENQLDYETKAKVHIENLKTLLNFSANLLRDSTSRSIYNSADVSTHILNFHRDSCPF